MMVLRSLFCLLFCKTR